MDIKTRKTDNAVILDLAGPLKMGKGDQEFRDAV